MTRPSGGEITKRIIWWGATILLLIAGTCTLVHVMMYWGFLPIGIAIALLISGSTTAAVGGSLLVLGLRTNTIND